MPTIDIQTLHCNKPSETGHDEVYMKILVDGDLSSQYPPGGGYESMGSGDDWQIDQDYAYDESCVVSFYDSDTFGDDSLGSFTVQTSGSSATSPVSLSGSGGSYTCTFTVTD